MKFSLHSIEQHFVGKNHFTIQLSFLRILMSLWLLAEVLFSLSYYKIIFNPNLTYITNYKYIKLQHFIIFIQQHYEYFAASFIIVILLNLLGIGKSYISLLTFLCYITFLELNDELIAGGDKMAKWVLLYLSFSNSFSYFSLTKKKIASAFSNCLSNLGVYFILLELCLCYLQSGLYKLENKLWLNGTANYYVLQLVNYQGTPFNTWLANNKLFVMVTTYFTLAFEILFSFLIFIKPIRKYLIVAGVLMHFTISILLMLYNFQFVFVSIYILLVSQERLLKVYAFLLRKFSLHKAATT